MNLLSKIFSKKEKRIWYKFNNIPNTENTLNQKAKEISPYILHIATNDADRFDGDHLTSLGWGSVLLEVLALQLHFMDRMAFKFIGPENRAIFMDFLIDETLNNLSSNVKEKSKIPYLQKTTFKLWKSRHLAYSKVELIPKKNENGGYNIRGSVGWKFSGFLGIENDGIKLEITTYITETLAISISELQIKEFFLGYK